MENQLIEQFLQKTQRTVDQALNELMEVKVIRENDPTEYSQLLFELHELKREAELLSTLHPAHKENLMKTKEKISEIEVVMERGI